MGKDRRGSGEVEGLVARDPRYHADVYAFVRDALDFTVGQLSVRGHVTGEQLLEGARVLAIRRFGPMARTVLEHWGVGRTEDLGEIVFNMVGASLLSKTDSDSREDFADGYNFATVFEDEYPWHDRG